MDTEALQLSIPLAPDVIKELSYSHHEAMATSRALHGGHLFITRWFRKYKQLDKNRQRNLRNQCFHVNRPLDEYQITEYYPIRLLISTGNVPNKIVMNRFGFDERSKKTVQAFSS